MKEKVKVLHVVGAMNRGGTETMLMNVYRELDRKKFQFDFVSYTDEEAHYDREIKKLNGNIIRLTKRHSVKQLYDAIKKHGPYDAVHAHTLFHAGIALFAATIAAVKVRIVHAHTTNDDAATLTKKIYMFLMRFVIRLCATHFLACSNAAGTFLFGKKTNYTFFPNAIPYETFLHVEKDKVAQFKMSEQMNEHDLVIGHIGTFKKEKNQRFLVSVLEKIVEKNTQATLLFIGDGEEKEHVIKEVNRKQLTKHVKFLGLRKDIPTILHSMDVFLLPSIYEGLGLVLLEAQASGVPSLVSDNIQHEADLKLDLVESLSLTAPAEQWAEKVVELSKKAKPSKDEIRTRFIESGFTVQQSLCTLEKLYTKDLGE